MHVISPKLLREFWARYPDAETPLKVWLKRASSAKWASFEEIKADFGARVDRYKKYVIFDIGGNKYRLIVVPHYDRKRVYIRYIITHAEYTLDRWKDG